MPPTKRTKRTADLTPVQGELQSQLMPVLWRLGSGKVEEIRAALPARYRSSYNTVQTVLNRLVDRGLLIRERSGSAYVYRPSITESEYLSRSIETALAGASSQARQTVLARLIGDLGKDELTELRSLAAEIQKKRGR